eukprot:m.39885 g.39885  ORF g.39885 m.39885 type:complete len:183 (+) comp9601_c0_seq2:309-857(+)
MFNSLTLWLFVMYHTLPTTMATITTLYPQVGADNLTKRNKILVIIAIVLSLVTSIVIAYACYLCANHHATKRKTIQRTEMSEIDIMIESDRTAEGVNSSNILTLPEDTVPLLDGVEAEEREHMNAKAAEELLPWLKGPGSAAQASQQSIPSPKENDSKQCPICGEEIRKIAKFCQHCGAKIS